MKPLKAGSLLLLGLWLGACENYGNGTGSGNVATVKGPLLAASDEGKTVSIGADEVLTVTLNAHLSTGYGWQLDGIDAKVLKLIGREQVSAPNIGGQDQQVLRFAGVSKGRAPITLTYRRPWETPERLGVKGTPKATFRATLPERLG